MKRSIFTVFLVVLFISSSLIVFPVSSNDVVKQSSSGITIYVDDDNTGGPWDGTQEHPYQHVQDGIDASQENDTLFVFNGVYNEKITIRKSISLIGQNKKYTIIESTSYDAIINVITFGVVVKNFTIQNNSDGYGIYLESSKAKITNNIIQNNRCGILVSNNCNHIKNNIIMSNKKTGIALGRSSTNNIIEKNTIKNNSIGVVTSSGSISFGVAIPSYNNKVRKNNFLNNEENAIDGYKGFFNNIETGEIIIGSKNKWYNNYWDRPRILPYIIKSGFCYSGKFGIIKIPTHISFDWHPTLKPNDI